MDILAHRGLALQYPENTFSAFEAALLSGFSIELDIHRTKDGRIVVMHDNRLDRTTDGSGKIIDRILEELKGFDCGGWFSKEFKGLKLSSLEEICRLFLNKARPHAIMAVNIKDDAEEGVEGLTIDIIDRYKLFERSFVFDMGPESAKRFKAINKNVKVAARVSEKESLNDAGDADFTDIIWLDEFFGNLYNGNLIREIRQMGKNIYAISPELHLKEKHPRAKQGFEMTWQELVKWEVDGICTDYPQALKEIIAAGVNK